MPFDMLILIFVIFEFINEAEIDDCYGKFRWAWILLILVANHYILWFHIIKSSPTFVDDFHDANQLVDDCQDALDSWEAFLCFEELWKVSVELGHYIISKKLHVFRVLEFFLGLSDGLQILKD